MEKETIHGKVKKIIYSNAENAYTVLNISLDDEEELTAVGYIPYVNVGEIIDADGEYKTHKQYGMQFSIDDYEISLPTQKDDILEYLRAGAFKGVGPITAERIVDTFGKDVFSVIENDVDRLSKIQGMTKVKAQSVGKQYKDIFGIRGVIKELSQFGIPAYKAARVYRRFGMGAVAFIKKNPYILCDEIFDIPFEQADELAQKFGVNKSAPCRLEAGIEYVINHNAGNGHTFLPYDSLAAVSADMLEADTDTVVETIENLKKKQIVQEYEIANLRAIYLKKFADSEVYIADRLMDMAQQYDGKDYSDEIDEMEANMSIEYAPLQKRAINMAASNGIFILTGGPGTGKTTALVGMVKLFEKLGKSYVLTAPTGRAAKRMSDVTGCEAKTIHRLLETVRSDGILSIFKKDDKNPIDADVVIVDETSMVEVTVFAALLKAIKPKTQLILVGDADQLPPVGAGNVFRDIIKSDLFASVALTEIFRQAQDSLIVVNAHTINKGDYPDCESIESDFFFVNRQDKELIVKAIVQLVCKSLPKKFGFDPFNDIQVLTPTRKGETGTANINSLLQKVLNPQNENKNEYTFIDTVFRDGDKIMQIKNNYDTVWVRTDTGEVGTGLFNGDIGIIKQLDNYARIMTVDFEGREAEISFDNLNEIELAYAITVHKSQGNEFPCVVMPAAYTIGKLATRNLLYTAVTRAKQTMVIVGTPDAVYRMVDNNTESRRFTGLKYLLLDKIEG